MSRFIPTDRKTTYLLPPSLEDWLNEDHLARFVVELIEQLDLSILVRPYAGRGAAAHHPATLLAILVYGYATGVFSSRRLERATYDSVAFRYLAANTHPDHDTLATFRRRFLDARSDLFVQVLEMAKEMKLLKLGTVCLDGAKIHANASRHRALSHGHIETIEVQLKAEVQELLAMAEAKAKIEARAKARYAQEKARYDEKMAARAARKRESGKQPKGRPPKAPEPGPQATDQINLTDEESRIMPVPGGGFEQASNAQAAVDAPTMRVVATGLTQAPNDKEQVEPLLATLQAQSATRGEVERLIADTGFSSEKNIQACEAAQIEPLIAVAKEEHHPGWRERHSEPAPLPEGATPMQTMAHRLKTKTGRAAYALRKQTVEPVFGIIKSVMGFRQLSLRGLHKATGEWTLVCLAWNVKRMAVLRPTYPGMG